ncbi:sulfotransferase [Glaciecola siphonariae]|uniref:Sulfotransferase n=1 Tax=Glaciecola siphonariae TaxID=521012 RepID=A0ABV9LXT8_9ALTE
MARDLRESKINSINNFKEELTAALDLIESSKLSGIKSRITPSLSLSEQARETDSLLARCASVIDNENRKDKPIMRVVHHFACSGGTLISKCISTLPNVYLMSEAHPWVPQHVEGKLRYSPTDITSLASYAGIPFSHLLAKKLFTQNLKISHQHVSKYGGTLVVREHTHSDYCVGKKVNLKLTVNSCLQNDFLLKHLVTVRNPVNSYLSLISNRWAHFEPQSFDEYCHRLLKFVENYPNNCIVKYEDFVESPKKTMKKICKILDLEYTDSFQSIFDIFKVTGDSGRTSNKISQREDRPINNDLEYAIKHSPYYERVAKLLSYSQDILTND